MVSIDFRRNIIFAVQKLVYNFVLVLFLTYKFGVVGKQLKRGLVIRQKYSECDQHLFNRLDCKGLHRQTVRLLVVSPIATL